MLSGKKVKVAKPEFYFPLLTANNRGIMKKILLLVFAGAFQALVSAQENTGLSHYQPYPDSREEISSVRDTILIKEVEIIAGKKPEETALMISRPDSLAIRAGLTTDLSELLSQNSSVFIKSYGRGSQATANFRGASASHTRIIWNGISLNSPMRGYTDLSLLPVFFVDDIYLLHGGSTLTESSGALGGSIHLGNKPDWKMKSSASAAIERASFNTGRYMGKLQTGSGNFRSITRFYYETSENDFPFYNVGVIPGRKDTVTNGEYNRKAVLQEFYWRTGGNLALSWRGWIQENNRNLPPLMSYEGIPRCEYQNDDQVKVQFEMRNFKTGFDYQLISGYNYSLMNYYLQVPASNYVIRDAASVENSIDNKFKFNWLKDDHFSFSGSVEMAFHQVKTDEKVTGEGYNKDRLEAGMFFHFRYHPSEKSGFFLISRSEYYDGKLIPLIPGAGGEWKVRAKIPLSLKMNVTRNYHKPGMNDLYWIPGGNPGLKPEQGITGEWFVSALMKGKKVTYKQEFSLFASSIKNWIIWQPAANGAWYWESSNLGKVSSRGLEYNFSASGKYRRWDLNMSGNYAYTRTYQPGSDNQADLSEGKQLIYIPIHSANMHTSATRSTWTARADFSFTGRRFTQASNPWIAHENALDPFWLAQVSLLKQFKTKSFEWSVRARIENIFSARYQQILWRPMPERNYTLTLFINFKNEKS